MSPQHSFEPEDLDVLRRLGDVLVRIGPAGRAVPTDPSAVLSPEETAWLLGKSPAYLAKLRLSGGGPPFVKFGGAGKSKSPVGYRRGDIEAWVERNTFRNTADTGEG